MTWALLIDALDHDGPAVPSRLGLGVCAQQLMPGVDPATFPMNGANAAIAVETSPAQELYAEGPLACYTTASCSTGGGPATGSAPAGTSTCVASGVLRFQLHAERGDRVTRVDVYLGGRLILRRRGRRIAAVRVPVPSARATIRIVTVSRRGTRRTSKRQVAGCRKGRPKTVMRPPAHRHR